MKPHPRIRKSIKWGGAALTVLLVAAWVWSGWFSVGYVSTSKSSWWTLKHGAVVRHAWISDVSGAAPGLRWGNERAEAEFMGESIPFEIAWTYERGRFFGCDITVLPLWPILLATGAFAVSVWYLDARACRRERAGKCRKCSYNRTGLAADARCPECGAACN